MELKQCLRYLQGNTTYGITFARSDSTLEQLIGYIESSRNVDPEYGKSTTCHIFFQRKPYYMVLTETRQNCVIFM